MILPRQYSALFLVAFAATAGQDWKDKPPAEWSDEVAQQLLSDSPWAKQTTPTIERRPANYGQRGGALGGMRRTRNPDAGESRGRRVEPPVLIVRWESALPIQEAELKTRNLAAPDIDESSYTIAIAGFSNRLAGVDPQQFESSLKHQAELKRPGHKGVHSSAARVLSREDGMVIVFLFPRDPVISKDDGNVTFEAQIGAMKISQSFPLDEMMYGGKLAL